ncbi:lipopolysaccharide transport periplasmic protein LptA [Ferrimonas lipolytica]|uniref:Lipopolysaccharide export system protein LptA n=1 Tax=Ferrimonas lipolytica TaxID=2724191 RepID=A0A6H1UH08_9GAMM|nr:lipopolysaccharide transport periplasmic protein LptA [Ferrimonas lipolytica]QIZ77890.1 lipopolysaccharide transport periplasmic protein LptA [Ferrimonas lipolytica]
MKLSKPLLIALALLAPQTQALQADFLQAVSVTADRSEGDLQSRTLSYIDNVVVTQGTLRIEADKLTLIATEDKSEQIFVATGNPATYEQVQENGMKAEANALEIRYSVSNRELILIGEAQMSQEGSVVKGSRISYNAEQQKLSAEGSDESQITTIFMPAPKTTTPTENQPIVLPAPELQEQPKSEPKP